MNTWVVSGCSSGLGRCWTHSIITDRQDTVIGITRSKEVAEEMVNAYQGHFVPCVADVQDSKDLTEKLISAVRTVGTPSRVVTAAGYAQFGTLEDVSNEQIRAQFTTNVEGCLNVIRPLLPFMREMDSSRILLVSSMSGVACWPLLGAYQISKYAIEAISDTLRQELQGSSIQVGCIEPGPHKTGWASTYARRHEISANYNASELMKRASCGYNIEDPTASLPYFWKMFDSPVMPQRIATSREFVEFAVEEAQQKIRDWRAVFDD
ncbi:SDR family NAD(P)-dependent oxidoreductase [Endozoicomonas sp. SM1973]|uniref:SDR family NAD(P)-dependent oxidoreductase n=1 Tax=Spartinivicinus marinus TaxID=2994442 RepID=A0A853IEI4_9GAMM|nr:SDR family NAD(P)-dependent oxidoreductase [Spartinivicinus marinus]MCX4028182.1 SDR family NAD(P)-dependent oxidoreductase [Spartinivicinus marinus]NYZ68381.1 SDR family NAD(P)-dependent oxidoreductase [Spartinivicinus marinus]